MEYTYSYIKAVKIINLLYNEILAVPELPSAFYINVNSNIDIVFNQQLSEPQITILNNFMTNYIPPQQQTISLKTETIPLTQNTILPTNTYTVIGTYFYAIPHDNSFINSLKIIASVDGNTNYKIRVYDSINATVLCESNTLNNQTLQIITISDILNLPTNETLLEIQCIVSGDNKCTVKLIQIEYSELI
jgi:hypothetical protein